MTDPIRLLQLAGWSPSGDQTSQALFNTNVIQSTNTGAPWFSDDPTNPLGHPTAATQAAIDHFGITMIRFPGGETDAVFQRGMMVDGALPDSIVTLLDYASDADIAVNLVVPVDTPPALTRAAFLDQMRDFATALHQHYPGVVQSFELGNEYWGGRVAFDDSLEFAYGQNAGEVALALQAGLGTANQDADVFLQAAGNLRGAFGNDLDQANGAIQDGFEQVPGAIDVLDGIIRNSYWKDPDLDGFENSTGVFAEDRGLGQNLGGGDTPWESWAGHPLLTRVGEYNINKNIALGDTGVDIGVHGASYLLEHVANMIEAGVDQAFLWPVSHNTQNAILFRDEAITTQTVHGMDIATNTTRAAMLDLMRQTVGAHDLLRADWSLSGDDAAPGSDVELTLFEATNKAASQADLVAFVSSRSAQDMQLELDLSAVVTGFESLRITSIHHAATGGNLRDAVVTELEPRQIGDGAVFTLTLRPYEVVQFAFDTAPVPDTDPAPDAAIFDPWAALAEAAMPDPGLDQTGLMSRKFLGLGDDPSTAAQGAGAGTAMSVSADPLRLWGGDGAEFLIGGAGDDRIFARGGDDTVIAGAGADLIRGGHGNDAIFGGEGRGRDTLFGDLGDDTLIADAGADLLQGGYGQDVLNGGAGKDTLTGGHGADRFIHADLDRGFDLIRDFEPGLDRLVFDDARLTGPDTIRVLAYLHEDTASTLIRFLDPAGEIDTSLGGVVLHGIARPEFDINSLAFPHQTPPATEGADTILPGYEGLDDIQSLLLPYSDAPDMAPDDDQAVDPDWTIAA